MRYEKLNSLSTSNHNQLVMRAMDRRARECEAASALLAALHPRLVDPQQVPCFSISVLHLLCRLAVMSSLLISFFHVASACVCLMA